MELRDLCCINKEFNFLKKEAFVDKVELVLKEKGITDDEELDWYIFFLKSALLFLEQHCRFEDFSFDSLIMLCKVTKFDVDGYCSTYDVLLNDWKSERERLAENIRSECARLVEDYRFVTAKKIPENRVAVLKEIFEEFGKQEHLVEIENECRLVRVKETEFKPSMVPKYVNSIDIVKDEETGERYFVFYR